VCLPGRERRFFQVLASDGGIKVKHRDAGGERETDIKESCNIFFKEGVAM
jgi:hypothetical protein